MAVNPFTVPGINAFFLAGRAPTSSNVDDDGRRGSRTWSSR
jgi:hypothetical protein